MNYKHGGWAKIRNTSDISVLVLMNNFVTKTKLLFNGSTNHVSA